MPVVTKTVDQADVECINAVEEYAKHADENKKAVAKFKYTFVDSNTVSLSITFFVPFIYMSY